MITTRDMTSVDKEAVLSIHKQSIYGICKDHYSEKEMKAWTGNLTPEVFDEGIKDENFKGIVAVVNDKVVGYGFLNLKEREIGGLYILPKYLNQGAGKIILTKLEQNAKENKINNIALKSTLNAVGFYEKMGYKRNKSTKYLVNDDISLNCVCMEKVLFDKIPSMVDIDKQIAYWRDSASEDWDVAQSLIKQKKIRHGLFFAHLSLEKTLKAHVCRNTGDLAPQIHNTVRLAEIAGIKLSEEQINVLADANEFNIEGRYPDMLLPLISYVEAKNYMERIEGILQCLNNLF